MNVIIKKQVKLAARIILLTLGWPMCPFPVAGTTLQTGPEKCRQGDEAGKIVAALL
jgi:hypothetical protein